MGHKLSSKTHTTTMGVSFQILAGPKKHPHCGLTAVVILETVVQHTAFSARSSLAHSFVGSFGFAVAWDLCR